MFSIRCNSRLKKKSATKTKPFINKYNWEGTNFSSEKDDWKKFEKNKVTIVFNVLYIKKAKKYILLIL